MPSSGITLYRAPNLPSQNMAANASQSVVLDSRGNVLSLPFPTNGSLSGVPFTIYVAGHCLTKPASSSLTLTCYFGSSSTIANNTAMCNTGARNTNNFQPQTVWEIHACANSGTGGSQTGSLGGYHFGVIGVAAINITALAAVTGIDPNQDSNLQSSAPLSLSLTTTFTAVGATDQYFIDVFELRV